MSEDVSGSFLWLGKWIAAAVISQWLIVPGAVHALVMLMGLDLAALLLVGWIINKHVSGPAFGTACAKKALTLIVLTALHVCTGALQLTFDLGAVGAVAFVANEGISILTNAALAGLPVPAQVLDALLRIQKLPKIEKKESAEVKTQ